MPRASTGSWLQRQPPSTIKPVQLPQFPRPSSRSSTSISPASTYRSPPAPSVNLLGRFFETLFKGELSWRTASPSLPYRHNPVFATFVPTWRISQSVWLPLERNVSYGMRTKRLLVSTVGDTSSPLLALLGRQTPCTGLICVRLSLVTWSPNIQQPPKHNPKLMQGAGISACSLLCAIVYHSQYM